MRRFATFGVIVLFAAIYLVYFAGAGQRPRMKGLQFMTQGSDPQNSDPSHPRGSATQRLLIACLVGAIIVLIVIAAVNFR